MGRETSKARARRLRDSAFDRYLTGPGIDIGCGDDPITDCLRWDLPQGDAATLPGLEPERFDWVYSSHCLEDLSDPEAALRRWWEVLKPGGCLLLVVPDEDLYEQGRWPSRFNAGHRHTFTAHKSRSWSPVSRNLVDLVRALPEHELLWLRRCDDGYDYAPGIWDRTHGPAEAALEVMLRKQRSAGRLPGPPPPASHFPLSTSHSPLSTFCSALPAPIDLDTALAPAGPVTLAPLRIYTGLLGQIGDIVMATAAVRRIKELYPNSALTFAVSRKYREAGELIAGLPYVDRLFITELYFERLAPELSAPWELGWPADLRGDDEIEEQRRHDLVFETRPRHRRMPWWEHAHQVEETAHMLRVPGPISRRTEVAIPPGTEIPPPSGAARLRSTTTRIRTRARPGPGSPWSASRRKSARSASPSWAGRGRPSPASSTCGAGPLWRKRRRSSGRPGAIWASTPASRGSPAASRLPRSASTAGNTSPTPPPSSPRTPAPGTWKPTPSRTSLPPPSSTPCEPWWADGARCLRLAFRHETAGIREASFAAAIPSVQDRLRASRRRRPRTDVESSNSLRGSDAVCRTTAPPSRPQTAAPREKHRRLGRGLPAPHRLRAQDQGHAILSVVTVRGAPAFRIHQERPVSSGVEAVRQALTHRVADRLKTGGGVVLPRFSEP